MSCKRSDSNGKGPRETFVELRIDFSSVTITKILNPKTCKQHAHKQQSKHKITYFTKSNKKSIWYRKGAVGVLIPSLRVTNPRTLILTRRPKSSVSGLTISNQTGGDPFFLETFFSQKLQINFYFPFLPFSGSPLSTTNTHIFF